METEKERSEPKHYPFCEDSDGIIMNHNDKTSSVRESSKRRNSFSIQRKIIEKSNAEVNNLNAEYSRLNSTSEEICSALDRLRREEKLLIRQKSLLTSSSDQSCETKHIGGSLGQKDISILEQALFQSDEDSDEDD